MPKRRHESQLPCAAPLHTTAVRPIVSAEVGTSSAGITQTVLASIGRIEQLDMHRKKHLGIRQEPGAGPRAGPDKQRRKELDARIHADTAINTYRLSADVLRHWKC